MPGIRATKIIYHGIINWEKRTTAQLAISYFIYKSNKNYSPAFSKLTFVNRHPTTGRKHTGIKKTQLLCLWAAPSSVGTQHSGNAPWLSGCLPSRGSDTRLTSHTHMSLRPQIKAALSGRICCVYACSPALRVKCDFNSPKAGIGHRVKYRHACLHTALEENVQWEI